METKNLEVSESTLKLVEALEALKNLKETIFNEVNAIEGGDANCENMIGNSFSDIAGFLNGYIGLSISKSRGTEM